MCIRDSIEGVWCGKRMVHRGVVLTAGNNESCALAVCRILGNGCVPAPLRDLNITRALSNVCPASLLECSRISDQPRFGHCVADRTKSRRIRRTRPVRPLISSTNWVDCTQAEMQEICSSLRSSEHRYKTYSKECSRKFLVSTRGGAARELDQQLRISSRPQTYASRVCGSFEPAGANHTITASAAATPAIVQMSPVIPTPRPYADPITAATASQSMTTMPCAWRARASKTSKWTTARIDPASANSQSLDVISAYSVSYTHLRAHETVLDLVCRLL